MKRTLFALSMLVLLALIAACAAPQPPVAQQQPPATTAPQQPAAPQPPPQPTTLVIPRGGEYKIATTGDAPTLHPFNFTDTTSSGYVGRLLTGALWRYNPETLEPEPFAAESWKVSDDKKTYTFKLRDMKWSDGKPLTAFDYQWTFEQAMKPENKWPYRGTPAESIASYKALNEKTLEVTLKEAKALTIALSRANAITPLPRHVWEKYEWNDPKTNPEILQPSVVSGLFSLKEWKRDDHITFLRNDGYWRGSPNIESLTIRIVPNTSVALQMTLNGEVDTAAFNQTDFDKLKASDLLNYYEWLPAGPSWQYIGFNLRRAALKDVELRHALAYATPRDILSAKVYNNLSKPTYSFVAPPNWAYNPDVPHYDYDIEKAKSVLDKAGYKLDASGRRLDKEGKPLKLKLAHNTPHPAREKTALIVQEEYKKLGVEIEIAALEWSAFLKLTEEDPWDWDLDVLGWSGSIEPSKTPWIEANIPRLNDSAYVNKKVEDLFIQGENEFDQAKRKAIYGEIQKILSEDSPYIFLVYSTGWDFLNKRVVGNKVTRQGYGYDFNNWYIVPGTK